jgi:hypothetical protein
MSTFSADVDSGARGRKGAEPPPDNNNSGSGSFQWWQNEAGETAAPGSPNKSPNPDDSAPTEIAGHKSHSHPEQNENGNHNAASDKFNTHSGKCRSATFYFLRLSEIVGFLLFCLCTWRVLENHFLRSERSLGDHHSVNDSCHMMMNSSSEFKS